MKKILILAMTICCTMQLHLASAQEAELQQLALNIEKLAQLKQVLSNMKKGYEIIDNGYGKIKNLSEGNFSLHQTFLDGLMLVNPELRKYKRVADIISYQASILAEYRSAYSRFRNGGQFTASEIEHMAKVYTGLLDRSGQQIDELTMVLSSGKLRMNDAERISVINRIYGDMVQQLSFLRGFNRRASSLQDQRTRSKAETEALKKLSAQ
jgi:hypothetical protein